MTEVEALRAEIDELRDALKQLYGVAYHRRGCDKGIPEEDDFMVALVEGLRTECPCGVRQALDRAKKLLNSPEERVARALMDGGE